jgi:L-threonylcarbamoyladenylate synthase
MKKKNPHQTPTTTAGQIIKKGGVIIFPTDTVYGLGCGAGNKKAIARIYRLKKRGGHKPLPVLISSLAAAAGTGARMSRLAKILAGKFWPGPLTIVVGTGRGKTVGLRIPAHKLALSLLRKTGPLATTSVNLSGRPSARKMEEIPTALLKAVDLVIDGGECPLRVESTVVDATGPEAKILREGYISKKEIEKVLKNVQ